MKRFDLLRTITFLILAYGIFSGNSCFKTTDTDVDSPCGEKKTWDAALSPDKPFTSEVIGNRRYYVFYDHRSPAEICSEEHVDVSYTVEFSDLGGKKPDSTLSIIGNAYWSLFGRESRLIWNGSYYYKDENIGLKQAYPDGTGTIDMQFNVNFPTLGDSAKDINYFDSLVTKLSITLKYREVKF